MSLGKISLTAVLCMFLVLASGAVQAGKGGRSEQTVHSARESGAARVAVRFSSQDRRRVYNYYGAQAKRRVCPPGLLKKGRGCMPPGPARKWAVGKPLPRDVDYRDLPRDLRRRLSTPPAGYRYVQVAGDVLLIRGRTTVVADSLRDVLR
jgi:Ni/Co efflux regulator RcnB